MTAHTPIPFEPAVLRPRHDGWTAEKQIAFIETLAATKCVDEACRRVGMSDTSAYELRGRPCGEAFARAWELALEVKLDRLEDSAIDRSINGVPRPIFYKGEQVGEYRHFDERLTMFMLGKRRPARFGKWLDDMLPPAQPNRLHRNDALADALFDISIKAPEEHGNRITNWMEDGDDDADEETEEGGAARE